MKRTLNRITAMLMAVIMFASMMMSALAATITNASVAANNAGEIVITNPDGTTEIVDESWEEEYPYGIFALEKSEMSFTEGG